LGKQCQLAKLAQFSVDAAAELSRVLLFPHDLLERTAPNQTAVFQADHRVAMPDRRAPVRDDNDRPTLASKLLKRADDRLLGEFVEGTGSFIQDQYRRVLVDCPRYAKTLTLTAREADAEFADMCLVTRRKRDDEVVQLRLLGRIDDAILVGEIMGQA
jgi:hypothetical protein